MKNKSLVVGAVIVAAVVILGVAYAAISNITLTINGSAAATPADANFTVKFSGTPTKTGKTTEATITDDHTATLKVEGLSAKGDTATATYTITNTSADLSAKLATPAIACSNNEYFEVTTDYAASKGTITAGSSTTLTVTVRLIKTPIEELEPATVSVGITASPVQPN